MARSGPKLGFTLSTEPSGTISPAALRVCEKSPLRSGTRGTLSLEGPWSRYAWKVDARTQRGLECAFGRRSAVIAPMRHGQPEAFAPVPSEPW